MRFTSFVVQTTYCNIRPLGLFEYLLETKWIYHDYRLDGHLSHSHRGLYGYDGEELE